MCSNTSGLDEKWSTLHCFVWGVRKSRSRWPSDAHASGSGPESRVFGDRMESLRGPSGRHDGAALDEPSFDDNL